jgi:hypothetical protein
MDQTKLIPVTLFFDAQGNQTQDINYGPNATKTGINISLPIDHVFGIKMAPLKATATNTPQEPRIMVLINEFASDAFNSAVKYHFVLTTQQYETSTKLNNNGEYWFTDPFLPPSTLSFTFSNGIAKLRPTNPINTQRIIIPVTFYCTLKPNNF